MAWSVYKIVLCLRSPLHIGAGKVGNLQRAQSYVAGRNLWGALTARLARDRDLEGNPDPKEYQTMGQRVHTELAFTYLFPTTDRDGDVSLWPWDDGFRYQFLSTYASTALDYAAYSAKEASLHEVECLTPYTRDPDGDGKPVYLTGYLFQQEGSDLDWRDALTRLQIGGERGYGWGRVEPLEDNPGLATDAFGYKLRLDGKRPVVEAPEGERLLAHTLAAEFEGRKPAPNVDGPVEPLVGRETRPDTKFGVYLSQARICYAPGSRVEKAIRVQIGPFGVWEGVV